MSAPKESFDQLVQFLSNWMACGDANGGYREDDNDDDKVNGGRAIDVNASNGGGGGGGADTHDANGRDDNGAVKRKKERLIVNFLRNLCHVFYFNCNQVKKETSCVVVYRRLCEERGLRHSPSEFQVYVVTLGTRIRSAAVNNYESQLSRVESKKTTAKSAKLGAHRLWHTTMPMQITPTFTWTYY